MSHVAFLAEIAASPYQYVACLLIAGIVYAVLLRRQIYSPFDPLLVAVIGSAFGAAGVLFMFNQGLMTAERLQSYALTELAFLGGIVMFAPICPRREAVTGPSAMGAYQAFSTALYALSSVTFIVVQGAAYVVRGVPLLHSTRLDYYAGGDGFGVVQRILSVSGFFATYLLCWRIAYRTRQGGLGLITDWIVGCAILLSAALSGAKSSLLGPIGVVFYFRLVHRKDSRFAPSKDLAFRRAQVLGIGAALAVAILVISVQTSARGDLVTPLAGLSARFVSYADVYFMAYGNGILDSLRGGNPALAIAGGFLAMFRIVSPAALPENLGFAIYRAVYGFDALTGPNPRHNIFGVVYFGAAGAVAYSFVLGLITGVVRNWLYRRVRVGTAAELLYVYMAVAVMAIPTDISAFMQSVGSIVLVGPPLLGCAAVAAYVASNEAPATN